MHKVALENPNLLLKCSHTAQTQKLLKKDNLSPATETGSSEDKNQCQQQFLRGRMCEDVRLY